MSLSQYRQKRRFERTPEPQGTERPSRGPLRFVVQKHQARRLHYDFRLELGGTLKSWAVPKGPSLNPEDKRLAMMVEDHPLEYRTFEGIIPEGNYGAGTVMIWDEGTYCSRQSPDREESERILAEGLKKGRLTFVLDGKKLHGEFALVGLKRGEENAWLLIKKRDQFATTADVTAKDRSAVSRRTLAGITRRAADSGDVWHSDGKSPPVDLSAAPRGKMPHRLKPMLATPVKKPFDRAGWLFEIKWDGYRAIAEIERRKVRLYSRRHLSYEKRFAAIVRALGKLKHTAVLDGEVVVVDEKGKPHFQLLQNYQKTGEGQLVYYVFDLLYLDGHDLQRLPLVRRKQILQGLVGDLGIIRLSEHVEEQGIAFFEAASQQGLEGIMAKDGASPYRPGRRSDRWLKIKTQRRQDAVIAGFTQPRGERRHFGALVLGLYEDSDLVYIGHTGGGFNDRTLADLRARLEPLVRKTSPFQKPPKTNAPVHWVEPELVCEVTFQDWTGDGMMRTPIFLGLREDKPPRSVRREVPKALHDVLEPEKQTKQERKTAKKSATKSRGHAPARGQSATDRFLPFTNLNKVYWPKEHYTKGDLICYYQEMAPVILPYLKDRPESLHRHPNGIEAKSFFQKDVVKPPPGIATVKIRSDSEEREINYLLCQDERTLLYLANLGCIELNPWHSRVGSLEHPDYVVMDLDPEDISFDRVVEAAQGVRKVLDKIGAAGYCKTSGKRGLHIYMPLQPRYDADQATRFASIIANVVHRRLPDFTSVERSPARRQKKVYLDFLQNRRGQTLAAAYSARPYVRATVSTPLKWSEVRKGLDPGKFTMFTMAKRLDKLGDVWKPVLGPGIDLGDCLKSLQAELTR